MYDVARKMQQGGTVNYYDFDDAVANITRQLCAVTDDD